MKQIFFLMLFVGLLLGLNPILLAQVDTDGDLNADVTDPWPNDPNQGGVYSGVVINYNVSLAGDLDATGFTGTVITLAGDGITFDGNNHKIIAPDASRAIHTYQRNGITLNNLIVEDFATGHAIELQQLTNGLIDNVDAIGEGSGTGIYLGNPNNVTVRNCNYSNRDAGIYLHYNQSVLSGGNRIEENIVTDCVGGYPYAGIWIQDTPSESGDVFIGNDCSRSGDGINTSWATEISRNTLTDCWHGLKLTRYNDDWGLDLIATVNGNSYTGSSLGLWFYLIESNTSITDLDCRAMGVDETINVQADPSNPTSNVTLARLYLTGNYPLRCSDLMDSNIEDIDAPGPGNEGIHLRNPKNITVRNCNFSGRVDGIQINYLSDYNHGGNRFEGNTLTNCSGHAIGRSSAVNLPSDAGDEYIGNVLSGSNYGIVTKWATKISRNTCDGGGTGVYLMFARDAKVNHNNIMNCTKNVRCDEPIELSSNSQGNYWGRECPGPLFEPGMDSNSSEVVDSYPYGTVNGWDLGETPGCNDPPTAEAGGPYQVGEGGSVFASGSGIDPDEDPLTYAWDLDNDGVFETQGQTVPFSAEGRDGPSSQIIKLQVTDVEGLSAVDEATVEILNVAAVVGEITAPIDPINIVDQVNVSVNFTDDGLPDTHSAEWNWGDGTTSVGTVTEENGSGTVTGNHSYEAPEVYTVTITVTDDDGDAGTNFYQYVVIYHPEGGFVTGAGWIDSPEGAYISDLTLTGKAHFGFVSKYVKGKSTPDGNTKFKFKTADLNFKSISYDWLVINHHKAKFKGIGEINDESNFGFMLSAIDGDINGDGIDRFRIKIWDKDNNDVVVYDNQIGDDADATDAIEAGNIVIHGGEDLAKRASFSEYIEDGAIPKEFELKQNYPNPFNPVTTIGFALPVASEISMDIYDLNGRTVAIISIGYKDAGNYRVVWNAASLPSGIYLIKMKAGTFVKTIKTSLMK